MLTRRVIAACAACAAAAIGAAAGGAGAAAATGAHSRPGSFGPGATAQLIRDTANAWKITQGSGVTVAVLSSGVDPNAIGLAGKVVTGHDHVDLPYPAPLDGTLIASAIASSGPTSASPVGPIGRAPRAKILSIRIYPDSTVPGAAAWYKTADWDTLLASAIREAARRGAQVIYADGFVYGSSAGLEQAVQYAISKNAVVIAAASGTPRPIPPAFRASSGQARPSCPGSFPPRADSPRPGTSRYSSARRATSSPRPRRLGLAIPCRITIPRPPGLPERRR
jgi:hypothetical protein